MEISLEGIGDRRAALIAGPTASGKSTLAMRLAEAAGRAGRTAVIVNADSMQVYDALRLLTARPSATDDAHAMHRLYGHVAASARYSVGAWLTDIQQVLEEAWRAGHLPIVAGGTGLYFKALTEGLAAIPAIPAGIRERLDDELAARGVAALHVRLRQRDPAAAIVIRPADKGRILRALEVVESTGVPISKWRETARMPPLLDPAEAFHCVIEPDRAALQGRISARLQAMVTAGAVDEVRALLGLGLPPEVPVMKAIGVREFSAVLRGDTPLAEAVEGATAETRRYAKRQSTWFRNQMPGWRRISG